MTDLAQDAYLELIGEANVEKFHVDTSSAYTWYRGQPFILDQNVDTANPVPYVDATVVAATDVFMGIAAAGGSVASGDNEPDTYVSLFIHDTIVGFVSTVFSAGDEGKTVYMSDSGTLSTTAADNPEIGEVHKVRGGMVFVRLITPKVCDGA